MSGAANHHLNPSQPEGVREALEYAIKELRGCSRIFQMKGEPETANEAERIAAKCEAILLTTTPSRGLVEAAEPRFSLDEIEAALERALDARGFRTLSAKGGAG